MGKGFELTVDQQRCAIQPVEAPQQALDPVRLAVPGDTIAGPWTLTAAVADPGSWQPDDPWHAAMDRDRVGPELWVRSRYTGERFQPIGMPGEVRLQNVMVNAKVPRQERACWPLVVGERGIAWVAGVRTAEWARVTPATRRVLLVRAERR
mgnify:CR=1 FL=1